MVAVALVAILFIRETHRPDVPARLARPTDRPHPADGRARPGPAGPGV